MKLKLLIISLFSISSLLSVAQDFTGYVKRDDSTGTPIYQASIQVLQAGRNFSTIKTYYDGSFRFTPLKNEAYSFIISYPGYKDTLLSVIVDRKGEPTPSKAIIKLKKDGMRLLGIVKSSDEHSPLKNVTVILHNIMTMNEERQTTGADGQYNFKLEYETNYRITVDKRSSGIFDQYRDTTFYFSTVGFNTPLDYPLDIPLAPDANLDIAMPDGYDASKVKPNKNLKPVVALVSHKNPYATIKPAISNPPVANNATVNPAQVVNKKPAAVTDSAAIKIQQAAVFYARQDSMNRVRETQKQLAATLAAKKHVEDSINRAYTLNRKKFVADSITAVRAENRRIAQEVVAQMHRRDSIAKTLVGQTNQK